MNLTASFSAGIPINLTAPRRGARTTYSIGGKQLSEVQGVVGSKSDLQPGRDVAPNLPIEETLEQVQKALQRALEAESHSAQLPNRFERASRTVPDLQRLQIQAEAAQRPMTLVVSTEHFERLDDHLSARGEKNVDQLARLLQSLDQAVVIEVNHPSQLRQIEPCLYRLFDLHRFSADRVRVRRADEDLPAGKIRLKFSPASAQSATRSLR